MHLYTVRFNTQVRSFVGNKTGRDIGKKPIVGSSIEQFKENVWKYIQPYIKQQAVWCENENKLILSDLTPSFEDLPKFVVFYDKSTKRSTEVDALNVRLLVNWSDKDINLYIYEFSTAVSSRALYLEIKSTLLKAGPRDRGGASANSELFDMAKRLKDVHSKHYRAQDINWRLWANYILKSESYMHDVLCNEPPPSNLIHLFARSSENSDFTVGNLRKNLSLAHTITDATDTDLSQFRTTFNQIKSDVTALVEIVQNLTLKIEEFDIRLTAMENRETTTKKLLNSMETAVGPHEDAFGMALLSEIEEQQDIDHS